MPLEDPNTVKNYFTSEFVLDKPKLTRMLNILEDRFKEAELAFTPLFEVTHANGKELKLTSLEDLFALDNPVNNPITELKISAIAIQLPTTDDIVNYLKEEESRLMQIYIRYDSDQVRNIHLSVKAQKSPKLSNQIFAELEEQIERSFARNWVYKYLKGPTGSLLSSILGILFMMFVLIFSIYLIADKPNPSFKSDSAEVQRLLEQSKNAKTTEDKVNFIFDIQTKQLEELNKPQSEPMHLSWILNLRNFAIILPLLIIIGCFAYLLKNCYPRAVFLWGDYETHYNDLMSKKKGVWTVVVLSLLFEVVGNLFVYGVSDYMK
jgi:hypothetical protein